MSTTIYVIRHAEKPDDPIDYNLSEKGVARSRKFSDWFIRECGGADLLFASQPSSASQRPYQTLAASSVATDRFINMRYKDSEYDLLAAYINFNNREGWDTPNPNPVALVCWHHGRIPHLMHELGAKEGTYPKPWDDNVFDLVLKLEYDAQGQPQVTKLKMPF